MKGSYLGTEYKQEEIENQLKTIGANFKVYRYKDLIEITSKFISNQKVVGWFQGRMELVHEH